MEVLTNFFAQYSIENTILFLITLAVIFKFVSEIFEYLYNKIRKYFNYQNQKDQNHNEIMEGINKVEGQVVLLKENYDSLDNRIKVLEQQSKLTTERLQENTRSYIIDKHHYFCYNIKGIDDLNLLSLERRYLYYKAAGGNSFIDGLMEEIRSLPKMKISEQTFNGSGRGDL